MKKAIAEKSGRTVTMTMEESRKWARSRKGQENLNQVAAIPDDKIDTSDIPEVTDFTGWVRNPYYRPVTQPVTIRLNAPDVAAARQLSKIKGLPYQTYIKDLLHEALQRDAKALGGARRKS